MDNRSIVERIYDRWYFSGIRGRLRNAYWFLAHRLHPRHKYNVLRTGLPAGYYDPNVRIPCAIFESVADFVSTCKDVDWKSDDGHKAAWIAFTMASEWWKKNRDGVRGDWIDHCDESMSGEEMLEMEDSKNRDMRDQLCNVINHIEYMWYP